YSLTELAYDMGNTDDQGHIRVAQDQYGSLVLEGLPQHVDSFHDHMEDVYRSFFGTVLSTQLDQLRDKSPEITNLPEAVSGLETRDNYDAMELMFDFGGLEIPLSEIWLQGMLFGSLLREDFVYNSDVVEDMSTKSMGHYTKVNSEKADLLGERESIIVYHLPKSFVDPVYKTNANYRSFFIDEFDFKSYWKRQGYMPTVRYSTPKRALTWNDIKFNALRIHRSSYSKTTGLSFALEDSNVLQTFNALPMVSPPSNRRGVRVPADANEVVNYTVPYTDNQYSESFTYSTSPGKRYFQSDSLRRIDYIDEQGVARVVWLNEEDYVQLKSDLGSKGIILKPFGEYAEDAWVGMNEYYQIYYAQIMEFYKNGLLREGSKVTEMERG
ncbi:MAG: hypothetical protein ACFFE8_17095, partial [Candidatus Heimdallarchaeota archaeon]